MEANTSSSKTLFLDNIVLFEWKNNAAVLGNLKHPHLDEEKNICRGICADAVDCMSYRIVTVYRRRHQSGMVRPAKQKRVCICVFLII